MSASAERRYATARRRTQYGFTLIELIVVVIILAVLAAVGVVSYNQFVGEAHDKALLASAKSISTAVNAQAALEGTSPNAAVTAAWNDTTGPGGQAEFKTAFKVAYGGALTYVAADVAAGTPAGVDVAERAGSRHACVSLPTDPDSAAVAASGTCGTLPTEPGGGDSNTPPVSDSPSSTPPPAAPATPAVTTTVSIREVDLKWAADPGATSYDLNRDGASIHSGPETTFDDTGLADKQAYTYTVTATGPGGSTTSAPVNVTTPSGGVIVTDNFIRANSTTTLGTTSDGTQAWQALTGTWGINTNGAYSPVLANGSALAAVDVGLGDQTITFTASNTQTGTPGIAFRITDANNFWYFVPGSSNLPVLGKVVNGVKSTVWTGSDSTNTGLKWTVQTFGPVIQVTSVTKNKLLTTVNDSFNEHGTKVGLYGQNPSISYRVSNFSAAPQTLTSPLPVTMLNTSVTSTAVTLSWPANTEPDLAGYRIYRDGTPIGTTAGVSYTDTPGPGTHSYQVASYDEYFNEAAKSPAQDAQLAPNGPVSVTDTFVRANSTVELGATSDGKQVWSPMSGIWGIYNHTAYPPTLNAGATGTALATLDVGSSDQTITFTAAFSANGATGVAFRVVDAKNFWFFVPGTSSQPQLGHVVNGVATTFAPVNDSGNLSWTIKVSGNSITVTSVKKGAVLTTATDTSYPGDSGATRVGLYGQNPSISYGVSAFSASGQ